MTEEQRFNAKDEFDRCAAEDIEYLLALVDSYRQVLYKISDPRKRDHKEPDPYTELGCIMNMADTALKEDE